MTKVQADMTKIQGSDDKRCGLIRRRESGPIDKRRVWTLVIE